MVAVKVTGCPSTTGLIEAVSAVVVVTARVVTLSLRALDVEVAKPALPE
jgi:hypothetical protein